MGAGKGPGRRKGSNDKSYRENITKIKGMNNGPDIDRDFEKAFMGKTAAEKEDCLSGKYFIK